jgi:hypothetical protein
MVVLTERIAFFDGGRHQVADYVSGDFQCRNLHADTAISYTYLFTYQYSITP